MARKLVIFVPDRCHWRDCKCGTIRWDLWFFFARTSLMRTTYREARDGAGATPSKSAANRAGPLRSHSNVSSDIPRSKELQQAKP